MKDLKAFLDEIDKINDERFVHHFSELIYDSLFALWHLSPTIERQLSEILSKVVIGIFFIRYLSHINEMVAEDADLKDRLTSKDLSDKDKIEWILKRLNKCDRFKSALEKDILPGLIDIIKNTSARDLTDLTRLAHAGDFLSSAMNDMRDIKDPDYPLWLESVPEYYDKDIAHMSLKKSQANIRAGKRRVITLEKPFSIRPLTKEQITDASRLSGRREE